VVADSDGGATHAGNADPDTTSHEHIPRPIVDRPRCIWVNASQQVSDMSADQPTNSSVPEADRQQTLADLHELVEALDRRVPHPDRAGERAIATVSAELKKDAEERIAQLEDPPAHPD